MRRALSALALCCAGAAVLSAAPGPAATPITLGETRPIETALGDPALPTARALWVSMIDGARRSLDLEEFYLSRRPGEALDTVLDAIGRAAARGVRVRLLLDAAMHRTYPMPADSLAGLANVSVRTVDYHRLAGGVQHAKFLIADGSDAWVGSQNLDWRSLSHIHELGARVRLPQVAAAFEDVFDTDWAASDTTRPVAPLDRAGTRWPIAFEQQGARGTLTVSASPPATSPRSLPWDRDVLVGLVRGARHEIVGQVLQYGVGVRGERDSTLHRALLDAAARGVRVRLIVSDWVLGGPNEATLRALAAAPNVEVRISRIPAWSGGYIPFARVEHLKFLVADSSAAWLGTANWEPDYFHATRNLAVTVHHRPLALEMRRVFDADWNAPSALALAPGVTLHAQPHGEQAPPGAKVYGE